MLAGRGRRNGYVEALTEHGVDVDPELIVKSTFSIDAGTDAALSLMRLASPPTAIFAVNDNTAIGAMSALINLGLGVPKDISLVGYNDIPIVGCLPR
ncbi:substrate-binding domain-containing protein [Sphingomonas sp. MA1305]|uniref:substrate-binding domain-containing protein n=1 Tax=Sphingomonas sp. MA1305 TaxID=2479204 RepID=UPI0018E03E88